MADRQAKVFVVQENARFQYHDAERFGELQFMTNMEYSNNQASLNNERIRDDIVTQLNSIEPGDFLLMTGNPVMMGYAFHIAAVKLWMKGHKNLTVLRWDNMRDGYVALSVPLSF